jgi:shikimate kinase
MHKQHDKIILTGFRATGKTTVGKMLAERLGLLFLDMDRLLVERHGPINEIVAGKGWAFFREKEEELLSELVGRSGLVIATGGGAIMHTEVWRQLKESGLVVWLTAPAAEIQKRLQHDAATAHQRPALTGNDALQEVTALLIEREPLYRAGSHLQLETTGADPRQLVEKIINSLRDENGR